MVVAAVIVLGLDPGSEKMGYGCIKAEGELLTYVEAGVLRAPGGWNKYRRLAEIGRELEALLKERTVDVVAMEAGFISPQRGFLQQGALVSAAARGMAGYLAARAGITVAEYANNTVKLAVTGHGRASKDQVAHMVKVMFRLAKTPAPDAADALAIAVTHARRVVADRRAGAAA